MPAQFSRLAVVSQRLNCAIGISQDGTVLHVDTGKSKFDIDANGETIKPADQESLC